MTKVREPISIENVLFRIFGVLTIETSSAITGRGESYLRACSDPDKRERLTIEDAIALDSEHHARTGNGFPLYEAYGRMMDSVMASRFSDAAAIGRIAVQHAKESGEAISALISASLPDASPADIDFALQQLVEADEAGHAAIARLLEAKGRPPDAKVALPP